MSRAAELKKEIADLEARQRTPARDVTKTLDLNNPGNVAHVRKGEDPLSSRPFRLLRLLGAMAGHVGREQAKHEFELVDGFRKALDETRFLIQTAENRSILYPLATSYLADDAANHPATKALMESLSAGWRDVDHDEGQWLAKRVNKSYDPEFQKAAMSYLTDSTGGSLVPPPQMGELIPLMRNKSAVDRAGAQQVPLPPQGKWVAPRVTGPSTGYWITENTAITESNPTTGAVELMAKKLACLVRVPNELFKYASAASDALFREDIAKTLALGFDYACLYGPGGGQPKGLINYTGTGELYDYAGTSPTPKSVSTNGNALSPEDGYSMAGVIEDRNFDIDSGFAWIMRGQLKGAVMGFRADSVSAGDKAGPFVQAITRAIGAGPEGRWCGYPVVATSQVRNTITKGSSGATLTECFGGVWGEFLQGIYGAVEFAMNSMGEATFIADQTLIRGILHCDAAPRYPGAFAWYKELTRNATKA